MAICAWVCTVCCPVADLMELTDSVNMEIWERKLFNAFVISLKSVAKFGVAPALLGLG